VAVVLNPPRDTDIAQLGTGDTDLHLAPPSLATAKTLPTMELPDETRLALDRHKAEAAAAKVAEAREAAFVVAPTVSMSVAPRPTATTAIPDTLQSAVYDPPQRSRWLWAVVAILAAAIGVVIGAIAGTR
jgi:hypothetical protein